MGENLVLNMNDHGYTVAVFNRTTSKVDEFLDGRGQGHEGRRRRTRSQNWSQALKRPRQGHDDGQGRRRRSTQMIEQTGAAPRTGRHHHRRRQLALSRHQPPHQGRSQERACCSSARAFPAAKKARATARPSCPAAIPAAWPHVKTIFQAIAAKVDDGTPCCDWVGEDGAGHYVKMVHNGIEYGDMQLICEAYQLMQGRPRPDRRRTARGLRRVEQGRARQLPDRDHRATSSPRRTTTARRWSTRSSTPPARRAPASGPASARSIWACR